MRKQGSLHHQPAGKEVYSHDERIPSDRLDCFLFTEL
jgi:hypothetical protein